MRDGEGAQKLIRIDVTGARERRGGASASRCRIANSPLVKTAIAGADANWGRIVMAVGKAGEPADRDKLKISFGGQVVAEKGERAAKYNEAAATKAVIRPRSRRSPSISASAKASARFGPATSPTAISTSMDPIEVE